jgi:ATP-dependent Lon protease
MESHSLVPQAQTFRLPIARMRSVFQPDEVERKLAKLPEREHESLRSTYTRMLERGPERFQVKPAGVPDMSGLYDDLPNFAEVLDDVKRHVAMSSMTAGWLLSGSSSQWKGSRPGKVFEALVDGQYANPVLVVDEIDKASSDAQYDPLGALYSLLEHDTAHTFVDEFAEVAIDASQVIWITTANDERAIPEPILNRMNVFEVPAPTREQARTIAQRLYQSIRRDHGWGERFAPEPADEVLDALAELAPREMRRALMTGFGNARLAGRDTLEGSDLPRVGGSKTRVGFLQ